MKYNFKDKRNLRTKSNKPKEEYAYVLDFLMNGYSNLRPSYKNRGPIAQVIGEEEFSLLDVSPKKDIFLKPHDRIYIGEGKRDKIHHILGRINYSKLTETAKTELMYILIDIIKKNEAKFINFINNAQPISTRMHSLELLPGLGKKRITEILEERERKPFTNFDDFKKRIKQIQNPEEIFAKRIIDELKDNKKHYLFVKWKEQKINER